MAAPLLASTGFIGWALLLLLAPGLLILIAVVVMFIVHPGKLQVSGPGYYHVLGFDRTTHERREATLHADSPRSARGLAEMNGIVVTEITQIDDSSAS